MRSLLFRFGFALTAQIALCAALNLFDDWKLAEMPVRFVLAGIACGVAFLAAVSACPQTLSFRAQALLFWTAAIVLRLVALPLEPGDDFWRYQWEGRIQLAGFNPYVQAPDDPALEEVRAGFEGWHKINHPQSRAIYPPGAELVFAGLSRFTDHPLFYKLVFVAADLATAGILLLLIGGAARYAGAAWYAWNPLVIYSFAGGAHFDSLMVLPMVTAIWLLTRIEASEDARKKWRLALCASALLGIAISIKLIPLLLLPLCVFALRRRAVALAVSLAIPAGLSLLYGYPHVPIWESLRDFAHVTRVNDLSWWLIEEIVWPNPEQKNYRYNVVIVVVVCVLSLLFWRNWKRGMLWVLGSALVLAPVLHPWYLAWILPLAAWRRAWPWQVLSISLFAYFLFWNKELFLVPWRAELWMRAIIILPPLAAAAFLFFARARYSSRASAS